MPTVSRLRPHSVHAALQADPRTDAELLDRFARHADQAAFGALVRRHGTLVYGVCRRALGPTADADDAFQATFLVLVRKAGAVPWRANLGPWLYGVAVQVTRKARFKRDRRFAVEKQVDAMPHPHTTTPDAPEADELSRAFDDELAALPDDMRRAVVLCELQGRSRQQAAKELRVSEGTLSSRLARARKLLRDRLTKRGITLAVPASVAVSTKLTAATVVMANGAGGVVPAAVSELAQEALKAMTISKLKLGAVLTAMAVGFTGFGLTSHGDDVKPPAKADPQVKPAAAKDAEVPAEPKKGRFELSVTLRSTPQPVATVHGQDVRREEFGEYLIRKYGAKEIESFVNQKIIEAEAKKRGVTVTNEEVEAALLKDLDGLQVTRAAFVNDVLPKYGKSEVEWREDVLRPRLTLGKLSEAKAEVPEEELRQLFERKYGEKRRVMVAAWAHLTDAKAVRDQYERAKKEPLAFQQLAIRVQTAIPTPGDPTVQTIDKTGHSSGIKALDEAAFALTKEDEVSDLIRTDGGWYAVKLVEIVPANKAKKFEDERPALLAAATKMKLEQSIPKLFEELKKDAKPVYHIRPEPKTYSVPLPANRRLAASRSTSTPPAPSSPPPSPSLPSSRHPV